MAAGRSRSRRRTASDITQAHEDFAWFRDGHTGATRGAEREIDMIVETRAI